MRLAVMIVAWGLIGWVATCFVRTPEPPCPRPILWKCFLAFVFGVIGGLVYYYSMGFKEIFSSIDFIASSIFAAVLGRFVYSFICPK